jgi:glycerophosphoryl diester phosphodiesterase
MVLAILAAVLIGAEPLDSVVRDLGMHPPRHGGVYVVAHRGAHVGIPENTLAAYKMAIELGCDFVEVDVRTTKDGRLVSMHNSTVDAYTKDAQGPVRGFTLAELKALDIGSRAGPEWRDERVPTMDEVFEVCKGKIGVYLDMKDVSTADMLAMVRKHGMERASLWYTGVAQQREMQRLCPECLAMPDPGPNENLETTISSLDPKPRIIASVMRFCSQSFVEAAHARGAIVITDEGSSDDWPKMIDWGMDGIQTNDPAKLIEFLERPRSPRPSQVPVHPVKKPLVRR